MTELKEDQENQYEDLQQLRERVHLSSNRLLDLTYNDHQFIQKLVTFNQEAKKLINQDLIPEALIYLAQAQRVLEYGASCGKTIDRNIIICTLHNEACCYYKQTELATAAKYVQAVIFNLNSHIASIQSTPSQQDKKSNAKLDEFQLAPVEKKVQLIHYYLKFCTISSQAKSRETALSAGKKVIQVAGCLFNDLRQENPKITACDANNQQMQLGDLKTLLSGVKLFKIQLDLTQSDNYLRLARFYLRKWNEDKVVAKISFSLQKHVNNYSISEVIDMMPMDYIADDDQYYDSFLSTKVVMRQLLHFSMGFFTISTQYRLMAEEMYKHSQQKFASEEYRRANIYHLLSILFLSMNIKCDLLFMKQIVSSYQHHFKTELSSGSISQQGIEDLTTRLLLQKPKPKTKFSTCLMQKITKLKMKDKDKDKQKLIRSEYEDRYLYDSKPSAKANQSNTKYKTKRSVSKNNVKGLSSNKNNPKGLSSNSNSKALSSSKKLAKAIQAQTLEPKFMQKSKQLQQNKLLDRSKDRSLSFENKASIKKRSVSKGDTKLGKETARPTDNTRKRTNDQYQLGQVKVPTGRKRINSQSSADLSISCSVQDLTKKKTKDKPIENRSIKKKQKKSKQPKQLLNKHYYL